MLLIAGATLLAFAVWFWRALPDPLFAQPLSAVLLAQDGELLGARIAADGQWRFPPGLSVPYKYRRALIEYEDRRFESHAGIDPLAIARAVRQNWRAGRVVSGASTLSMQVVRLARSPGSDGEGADRLRRRGLDRKFVEALLALRLEMNHDKVEILALHAAHAPFGGNIVGLEAAAWRYFGRGPESLSWAESATLAALPNQPALVTPGRQRARLQAKRDALLRRLHARGEFDALDLRVALAEPLVGAPRPLPDAAPHLLETLRRAQPRQHRFTATLDAALQRDVTTLVREHSAALAQQQIHNAAALVLDNQSGALLAYVGNSDWSMRNERGYAVDIVRRPRSTGSILKPMLYAAMLDSGQLLPHMLLTDLPTQIAGFTPENFDRSYRGAVAADVALAQSLNVPAVRMLREYGVERFHALLRHEGMSTLQYGPDHYGLTLVLGGAEGNLWDITHLHARLVAAARGDAPSSSISQGAAWLTLRALLEVPRPAEEGPWQRFLGSRQIAWKTGTSWGQRDAWAVGSSGRYTVGVWVGNADGSGRPGLTGAAVAAPLLFAIHNRLPASTWLPVPATALKRIDVCANDGYLANAYCESRDEWVPIASHFERQSPFNVLVHLDTSGRFRVDGRCEPVAALRSTGWFVLPAAQEFFFRRQTSTYRELPPWRADCAQSIANERPAMDFIYPMPQAEIVIPRDLGGRPGRTVLEAVHRDPAASLLWHLDGRFLGTTRTWHQQALDLAPGPHVVTIVDAAGNRIERRFKVVARELTRPNDPCTLPVCPARTPQASASRHLPMTPPGRPSA